MAYIYSMISSTSTRKTQSLGNSTTGSQNHLKAHLLPYLMPRAKRLEDQSCQPERLHHAVVSSQHDSLRVAGSNRVTWWLRVTSPSVQLVREELHRILHPSVKSHHIISRILYWLKQPQICPDPREEDNRHSIGKPQIKTWSSCFKTTYLNLR